MEPAERRSERLSALDVFRGMTIAGMLVVNTPGSWDRVYAPLLHAPWNGWTYTDTIFPFFLFIVGVSMAFSFSRRLAEDGSRRNLFLHTLWRASVIFLLGLGLNFLSSLLFHRGHVRIPGVLQRIGLCFLLSALVYLLFGGRGVLPAAAVLLAGYWALMTLVPVPGYGKDRLDVGGNLAAYVDRTILSPHTWKHDPGWDPEGLLSTLPAVATTLLGVFAGELLRSARALETKIRELIGAGWLAAGAGLAWGAVFPINKNLWTSSYALFMSGLAAASLAVCIYLVDVKGWKSWAVPFLWLGRNAIALFVGSVLATLLLLAIKLPGSDGKSHSLYAAIYRAVFDHFADARLGSLLFALAFCATWIGAAGLLYRKRIFIKV
ncbi:MAG TPA: heparan-alpha-glucosaminide N-acetyltransferase domain-containing protein [Thermoanaerobaculia bacterium]|nr:heparan-alpha-glucosaminide N-acetyltransferase domain-containing protein [Thermoanaerobaculia bacterium]